MPELDSVPKRCRVILPASFRFRIDSGMFWHVYRELCIGNKAVGPAEHSDIGMHSDIEMHSDIKIHSGIKMHIGIGMAVQISQNNACVATWNTGDVYATRDIGVY